MQRFTQLYFEIDQTNRTNEKVEALARYFREAPAADAAWKGEWRLVDGETGEAQLRAPPEIVRAFTTRRSLRGSMALIMPRKLGGVKSNRVTVYVRLWRTRARIQPGSVRSHAAGAISRRMMVRSGP